MGWSCEELFKCYVSNEGVSHGHEKSVTNVYGSMLLSLQVGGWVSIFQKKALHNT